jgi:hypothetical protein
MIEIMRRLIVRVAVHAAPGRGKVRIEVIGSLAELVGDAFESAAGNSRGSVVAGVRNRQSPTDRDALFSLSLVA